MTTLTKICRRCRVEQPIAEFSKRSVSPDGHHLYCRDCVVFLNVEARLVKKGLLVRVPKRKATEKACTRCKQMLPMDVFYLKRNSPYGCRDSLCPPCWTEYNRERKAADPESAAKLARRAREWRKANPEKASAASRRHWLKNRERLIAVNKQWQLDNPERSKAHRDTRRALKKAARVTRFTSDQLAQRMAYFGSACWMCGGPFDEVDHVKPLSKGGIHALSNMRPSCDHCNNTKHARWYGPQHLDRFVKA